MNSRASTNFKWMLIGIPVLLVLLAYFALPRSSAPAEADPMSAFKSPAAAPAAANLENTSPAVAPVAELLDGLRQRLQQQPGDVDGWVLLSKSYFHLNRQAEAQDAFAKALALGYRGKWQPLPAIDTYHPLESAKRKFESPINFRRE